MRYIIIPTNKLTALGYDTAAFRKSVGGAFCISHEEYIKQVFPNYASDPQIVAYDHNSPEMMAMLAGPEWMAPEGATPLPVATLANKGALIAKLKAALDDNKAYLALTAPLAADRNLQVERLTKQNKWLIKILLNLLADAD